MISNNGKKRSVPFGEYLWWILTNFNMVSESNVRVRVRRKKKLKFKKKKRAYSFKLKKVFKKRIHFDDCNGLLRPALLVVIWALAHTRCAKKDNNNNDTL